MSKPLQIYPCEPIHVDGQNQATELHQHQYGWEAHLPAKGWVAEGDGPNQAVRALQSLVKERTK